MDASAVTNLPIPIEITANTPAIKIELMACNIPIGLTLSNTYDDNIIPIDIPRSIIGKTTIAPINLGNEKPLLKNTPNNLVTPLATKENIPAIATAVNNLVNDIGVTLDNILDETIIPIDIPIINNGSPTTIPNNLPKDKSVFSNTVPSGNIAFVVPLKTPITFAITGITKWKSKAIAPIETI